MAESLPPIGVFWDIENCGVPCRKSALAVVSRIRERFFAGHREAEFMCVCDISKENREVIQELNYAQVAFPVFSSIINVRCGPRDCCDMWLFVLQCNRPVLL